MALFTKNYKELKEIAENLAYGKDKTLIIKKVKEKGNSNTKK